MELAELLNMGRSKAPEQVLMEKEIGKLIDEAHVREFEILARLKGKTSVQAVAKIAEETFEHWTKALKMPDRGGSLEDAKAIIQAVSDLSDLWRDTLSAGFERSFARFDEYKARTEGKGGGQ